jgi:hypothetical protein
MSDLRASGTHVDSPITLSAHFYTVARKKNDSRVIRTAGEDLKCPAACQLIGLISARRYFLRLSLSLFFTSHTRRSSLSIFSLSILRNTTASISDGSPGLNPHHVILWLSDVQWQFMRRVFKICWWRQNKSTQSAGLNVSFSNHPLKLAVSKTSVFNRPYRWLSDTVESARQQNSIRKGITSIMQFAETQNNSCNRIFVYFSLT